MKVFDEREIAVGGVVIILVALVPFRLLLVVSLALQDLVELRLLVEAQHALFLLLQQQRLLGHVGEFLEQLPSFFQQGRQILVETEALGVEL